MSVPPEVEAEFDAQLDQYAADWGKSLRKHIAAYEGDGATQMSIVDPPLRDRAASQAAKTKDDAASAASPLSAEIRRRLDGLLKKN